MSRTGGFADAQEPLDDAGRASVMRAPPVPPRYRLFRSPARAAQDMVHAMGLAADTVTALGDLDFGHWTGRSLAQVSADEPDALARWLAAPSAGTPGGEAMADACARIGGWIDDRAKDGDLLVAITHPMMVRAALMHMIGLPASAAMAIDIAPLSRTSLSHHGRWRLQSIVPQG